MRSPEQQPLQEAEVIDEQVPSVQALDRPPELDKVSVTYSDQGRVVTCFCGQHVNRSIVPHLKSQHPEKWETWVRTFIRLRAEGYSLKRIMRLFKSGDGKLLFSWTVIERAIMHAVEDGGHVYVPPPKTKFKAWTPEAFALEKTTVWSFPNRGDWAVHSGDYRGNWPPQIPRNLIDRYTTKGDLVVDAFVGGGTTLIEAWLLGRRSIGTDISKTSLQVCSSKLDEMEAMANGTSPRVLDGRLRPLVIEGSALRLTSLLDARGYGNHSVRLLCAHPPYLDSIRYTTDQAEDLSSVSDPGQFCRLMVEFAGEVSTLLAPGGVCAVLIGDVRKEGTLIPLGFDVLNVFMEQGFRLDSLVVKTQHKDRSSEFYLTRRNGQLLMAHEYLFILRPGGSEHSAQIVTRRRTT